MRGNEMRKDDGVQVYIRCIEQLSYTLYSLKKWCYKDYRN